MKIASLVLIAISCMGPVSFAQQKAAKPAMAAKAIASDGIWTRRVSRLVNIADTTDLSNRKLRLENDDTPLSGILVKMVLEGKVKAYSNRESNFSEVLTAAQLKVMLTPVVDTMVLEDPVTGQQVTKLARHEFNFDGLTKYRVLEEWAFNKNAGSTSVQIIGLAPVRDIYGDDGTFRGRQSMFWLKYEDIKEVLRKYDSMHPAKNISLAVWEDYLSEVQ